MKRGVASETSGIDGKMLKSRDLDRGPPGRAMDGTHRDRKVCSGYLIVVIERWTAEWIDCRVR